MGEVCHDGSRTEFAIGSVVGWGGLLDMADGLEERWGEVWGYWRIDRYRLISKDMASVENGVKQILLEDGADCCFQKSSDSQC